VVRRYHPEPDIELTLIGDPGDAGDPYRGLDRFGRLVELLWKNLGEETITDHFAHKHNANTNRILSFWPAPAVAWPRFCPASR
jgi:hypothetical protein